MLDEMLPMEDYMVYCLTNTKEMKILGEKVMEYEIAKAKLFIDSGAYAIFIADDIAFNSGVFLPPEIMEELVYPFHKIAVQEIKKHRNIPVFFHSNGDLGRVMSKVLIFQEGWLWKVKEVLVKIEVECKYYSDFMK